MSLRERRELVISRHLLKMQKTIEPHQNFLRYLECQIAFHPDQKHHHSIVNGLMLSRTWIAMFFKGVPRNDVVLPSLDKLDVIF